MLPLALAAPAALWPTAALQADENGLPEPTPVGMSAVSPVPAGGPAPDPVAPPSGQDSEAASAEAIEDLEAQPDAVQVACAEEGDAEVCMRRRTAGQKTAAFDLEEAGLIDSGHATGADVRAEQVAPELLAVSAVAPEYIPPVCEGTGSGMWRVQPVYAHTSATADSAQVAKIAAALNNIDWAFTQSAARTGGDRQLRWVTDHGSADCRRLLRTANIGTGGAASYDGLMDELVALGAVTPQGGSDRVKYIVFTEGSISPDRPSTCGLGEAWTDDRPWGPGDQVANPSNLNQYTSRAAVDERCWDINGGGSTSAHEIMHTLGAVQETAPNAGNHGHCHDEYDLMCYGEDLRYECPTVTDDALFDCGNDDYFNTDPLRGSYLCDYWNTARSSYLVGHDDQQSVHAVASVTATDTGNSLRVDYGPTRSCQDADFYRVQVAGVGSVDTTGLVANFNAVPGTYTVTVTPWRNGSPGPSSQTQVAVKTTVQVAGAGATNSLPYGGIVLSATDGRGYGMLAWALDPETNAPVRTRVVIPGVLNREFDWNYWWADMPAFTGTNRHESLVVLAQLPPGTHDVCFDALDPQTGGWTRLDCRTHTVK